MSDTPHISPGKLAYHALVYAKSPRRRYIVGIAGIPGSGKSTLAAQVIENIPEEIRHVAKLVPMDGFHLTNARLEELKLRHLKGAPQTFDAAAYIDLLRRARDASKHLHFPIYDRNLHEPVLREVSAQELSPDVRIVITEGNYLLLDQEPWSRLAEILGICCFVDTPADTARERIIQRHVRGGRTQASAEEQYERVDLSNSRLVLEHRRRADWILNP